MMYLIKKMLSVCLSSLWFVCCCTLGMQNIFAASANETLDAGIKVLQKDWAIANYKTPEKQQQKVFEALISQAEKLVKKYPGKAEPLIWNGIIVSTYAGVKGGLGALSLVKKSKALLEKAEKIDATALQGSVYTSLGSLYYQVPGWPIGFGDDEKAEQYLNKALKINPAGIDPNYFYGDFLYQEKRWKDAKVALQQALKASDRSGRSVADAGRRKEVNALLAKVVKKLQ